MINSLPLHLVKEIISTPNFLKSFELNKENLEFLKHLTALASLTDKPFLADRLAAANIETSSILKATEIFQQLKIYKDLPESFHNTPRYIEPPVQEILNQIEAIPPEQHAQEDFISSLPKEILMKILSEGGELQSYRVSTQFYEAMRLTDGKNLAQHPVWTGIVKRISGPDLTIEDNTIIKGAFIKKIFDHCSAYKIKIQQLPEATKDIKLVLTLRTSIEQTFQLKEWKKNRDAFVVWRKLSTKINKPLPSTPQTFHEMMEKEERLSEWCTTQKPFLTQSKSLSLTRSQLTTVPEAIWNHTWLTSLNLGDNMLFTLSNKIESLTLLTHLNLGGNRLSAVPATIGNLTQLTKLFLNNNWLTALPDTIGNLTELTELFLNNNQLTALPDTIGNLTKLTELPFESNRLTALPATIRTLTRTKLIFDPSLENAIKEIFKDNDIYYNRY